MSLNHQAKAYQPGRGRRGRTGASAAALVIAKTTAGFSLRLSFGFRIGFRRGHTGASAAALVIAKTTRVQGLEFSVWFTA
jgi:hypothetical protein